ncbi:MAG: oxidoreductase [Ignavibacteria bacterium]|nr:oxidoreductase [Ignavibacteria bacterium]
MKSRTALLAGASGLVGGHCLKLLLQDPVYERIVVLVRSPLNITHERLVQHVVDFDQLDRFSDRIIASDVFCCLGTTMKTAGSQAAFRTVDYVYPTELARISAGNRAEQFLIVTALGADPSSSIFYNRVKGETEEAVKKNRFQAIHIFRPSMLLGDRKESRPAERVGSLLMRCFGFVFVGKLRKYRAIQSAEVAQAMVYTARQNCTGIHIYESDVINSLSLDNGRDR